MTQKALMFVVNGMLNNEREIAERRIARILSMGDESVIDGFTDGFVTDVQIVNEDLFEHIMLSNQQMDIIKLVKIDISYDGNRGRIDVVLLRKIWRKKDGKSWEYKHQKEGEYTEESSDNTTITLWVEPGSNIPGVTYDVI